MKKFIFFSILSAFSLLIIAQTGPAGIGNSSNLKLWLDASSLSLNNNDPVNLWSDISGNAYNASQSTSSRQPTFLTNQINGLPTVKFDGTDDLLSFSSNFTSGDITYFMINRSSSPNLGIVFVSQKHLVLSESNLISTLYTSPNVRYRMSRPNNTFSIFSFQTDGTISGSTLDLKSGNISVSYTRNSLANRTSTSIGNFASLPFNGDIAEVLIYDEVLNGAKRKIIGEYLGAKYNLTTEGGFYAFGSSHGNDLIGIGQESDGNHITADNGSEVVITNPSNLNDGEYLLIGHDNGSISSNIVDVPNGINERVNRVWRADETGDVGTVSIHFDYTNASGFLSPTSMVMLIDNDGDFSNGGATIIQPTQVNVIPLTAEFDLVDIPNGSYFTFAEKDVNSINNGQWDQITTWDCNCVPTDLSNVTVRHNVTIDSPSDCDNLTIDGSGDLTFSGSDSLRFSGDFNISGTFDAGTGRIVCNGQIFEQVFNNSTANRIDFYDLRVDNVNGTRLATGEFGFKNKLKVDAGGLSVDGANPNPAVLIADTISGRMCQILPSMDGAFTGEFLVERAITGRPTNFSNISSPITNGTIGDIDDDIFLSGVGGANGTATTNTGIFRSVYVFNAATQTHTAVTTLSTALTPGRGFEVFLGNSLTQFSGAVIGFEGTPSDGPINAPSLNTGWNLMGNPYHCFIDASTFNTTNLGSVYYTYNSTSGAYSTFTFGAGIPIAGEQGFWLDASAPRAFSFAESNKLTNLNGTAFLRKNLAPEVRLNISKVGSELNQDFVTRFDSKASSGHDVLDARYLPSPHKEVPAITRRIEESNTRLIMNVVDDYSFTHRIPLEFYAGVNGDYEIKSEDISNVYEIYNCVYLEDKENGELIDLSVDQKYAFTSTEGKFDRFELILSNSYEECLKENTDIKQKVDNNLSLRNALGDWYLDYAFRGDREERIQISIYNTAGQLIQNTQSYSIRGSGSLPLRFEELRGIYIIRIQSNNEFLNQIIHL